MDYSWNQKQLEILWFILLFVVVHITWAQSFSNILRSTVYIENNSTTFLNGNTIPDNFVEHQKAVSPVLIEMFCCPLYIFSTKVHENRHWFEKGAFQPDDEAIYFYMIYVLLSVYISLNHNNNIIVSLEKYLKKNKNIWYKMKNVTA